jgi:large subunit ribosomal protein L30
MAKRAAKKAVESKLRVTLVKSPIGNQENHKRTVTALGFSKVNQTMIHPDNPSVRGMIMKVIHLVAVEEVQE